MCFYIMYIYIYIYTYIHIHTCRYVYIYDVHADMAYFLDKYLCDSGHYNALSRVFLRSRHTSGRSHLNPMGHRGYLFVRVGNILSGRTVVIALLAAWCGLRFLIEQPDGSFLEHLPRYQWLFGVLKAVKPTIRIGVKFIFSFSHPWPNQSRKLQTLRTYLYI